MTGGETTACVLRLGVGEGEDGGRKQSETEGTVLVLTGNSHFLAYKTA